MGSFRSGEQRYSLMTMEAMKATNFKNKQNKKDGPLPISRMSKVILGNFTHLVKPVEYEEAGIIDDEPGKFKEYFHYASAAQ